MTTTPTPASQPSPARSDTTAERVAYVADVASRENPKLDALKAKYPARSDKDAERHSSVAEQLGIIPEGMDKAEYWRDQACKANARALVLKKQLQSQESAPSSDLDDEGVSAEESIDTEGFYELACSWKNDGDALWSDIIDHINTYAQREIALARRATAGTTAAPIYQVCRDYSGVIAWFDVTKEQYECCNANERRAVCTAGNAAPTEAEAGQHGEYDRAFDPLYLDVMNIICDESKANEEYSDRRIAYKHGHRDARHSAADLIAEFASRFRALGRKTCNNSSSELAGNTATAAPGDLPPLPYPEIPAHDNEGSLYSTVQMREYGRACIASNAGAAPGKQLAHGHRDDWYLMANARRIGMMPIRQVANMTNWNFAHELFATGSNSSHQICVDAGIDPAGYTVERAPSNPPVGAKEKE